MLVSYESHRLPIIPRTTRLIDVVEVGQRGHRLSAKRWTNPVLLETVLRAKEAVLDPQLQACRALERPSIVVAVDAEALALGGGLIGHGGRWVRVSVAKGRWRVGADSDPGNQGMWLAMLVGQGRCSNRQ